MERVAPNAWELLVGFVTDFLDTLGIGSFATTTSLYRARKTIDDRLLPGRIDSFWNNVAPMLQLHKDGKLRMLAVTTAKR